MRKVFSLFLFLCFATLAFPQVNNFSVQETYIGFYIVDSYLNIIEYNIAHNKKSGNVANDVEAIKSLVKNAKYADTKFAIDGFFGVEEKLTNEGKYVKGTYDLLTSEKPTIKQIEEVFSKILGTKVSVKSEGNNLNMYFDGTGITICDSNSEGVYKKGNTIMISWSNRLSFMELVFDRELKGTEEITSFVKSDVISPEKSAEEIDYLKNAFPVISDTVEKELQDNCDIVRLNHLKYYGELIEEFKKKTGHYPFEGKSKYQIYAFVFNGQQKKYAKDTNPNKHEYFTPKQFFAELESGLGRKIDQKFDPQYAPTSRPNFYIYMIEGDTYYFAVHLSKYYSFSKKIDDYYYKAEVSNKPDVEQKFYSIKDLSENKDFKTAISTPLKNESYFKDREEKHKREYK